MSTTIRGNAKAFIAALMVGAAALAMVLMLSTRTAHADTLQECQQKLLSGQIDINQYLACVAAANASSSTSSTGNANNGNSNVTPISTTTSGTLPVTGSDTGRLVGIGAALIVLGGAALYGATRRKDTVEVDDQA